MGGLFLRWSGKTDFWIEGDAEDADELGEDDAGVDPDVDAAEEAASIVANKHTFQCEWRTGDQGTLSRYLGGDVVVSRESGLAKYRTPGSKNTPNLYHKSDLY